MHCSSPHPLVGTPHTSSTLEAEWAASSFLSAKPASQEGREEEMAMGKQMFRNNTEQREYLL